MLYVFNRKEELIGVLEQGDKEACPYNGGKIKRVLNGEQILTFRAPLNNDTAKQIEELGYIARRNKNNQLELFLITELIEVHGESLEIDVTCEGAYVELDGVIIENELIDRKSPALALGSILNGTRWTAGNVTGTESHDLTIKFQSVLYALQKFRERWNGEITFRIEIAGNKISKRYVDFTEQKGSWKGQRLEFDKDITEITRTIDAKNIRTALYGTGKATPEGETTETTLDFSEVIWSKANGDPTDKPAGQNWVGDPEALDIWGKPLTDTGEKVHLFGVHESNAETPEELLTDTWNALQELKNPLISYEVKAIDFFRIYGIEVESKELGELLALLDKDLGLELQARISEYEEDLDYPENDAFILGNLLPTFTGDNFQEQLNDLSNQISQVGTGDYLEAGDPIDPSWLDTEFLFARDQIRAGGGTVQITEGNGILIVDDPDNPQKAIRLQAGQIALANTRDLTTGEFNWRNFGTGEGWLSSLVETGKLSFNDATGGTLELGGQDNQSGELVVNDSTGEEIARLSGAYGGFGTLRIDELLNTKNIVFRTWGGIFPENADPTTGHLYFYVDPNDGDDNNLGTEASPKQTIQPILDSLPKYLERNVYIRFVPALLNDSIINIQGFIGEGSIYLQKWNFPIQYIRDYAHSSTANTGNHWVEVQATNLDGGAEGGNTANLPWNASHSHGNTLNREYISDYDTTGSKYFGGYGGMLEWVTVNIRFQRTNLDYLQIWHYYSDARRYYKTKTQVSADSSRWFTIFDSARQGEYAESSAGKKHYISRGFLIGAINVLNNSANVYVHDLFVDTRQSEPIPCINNFGSQRLEVKNVVTFGHPSNEYNLLANAGFTYISNSEINTSAKGGLCAVYGGHIHAENVVGGGHMYGHFTYGGTITGLSNGVLGSTFNNRTEAGGENRGTWTHKTGVFSPFTITQKTETWTSTSADTWSEPYSAWRTTDNDVLQGKYASYGLYRGLWFYGTSLRTAVMNKTIKKIRIYVTRANSSGNTKDSSLTLRWHGYASKPSGAPTMSGEYKTVLIDRGESMWVDVTSNFKDAFQSGNAYGIGIYTASSNADYYIRMTQTAKIEITYEIIT